ncbi:MAG: hypothetical protein ACRDTP_11970 [Mycobacteriales bacterium]
MSDFPFFTPAVRAERGITEGQVRAARRRGDLVHVWRGLDVTRDRRGDRFTRLAAIATLSGEATLSGPSAARLWRLPVPEAWADELTFDRASDRVRPRPGLRIVTRSLPPGRTVAVRGLRVTDPSQTLVDLLCRYDGPHLLWVVEQGLARGVDPAIVGGLITPGRRGAVAARRMLGLADARGESPLESAVALALHGARIPEPERQWPIVTPRLRARLDFAWPERMVALEADGVSVHSAPEALLRDRTRQNALAILGWTILRCTWHDVVPAADAFVRVVSDALRRAPSATNAALGAAS